MLQFDREALDLGAIEWGEAVADLKRFRALVPPDRGGLGRAPVGAASAVEGVARGCGAAGVGAPIDRQEGSWAGAAYVFEAPGAACRGNVNGDGAVDLADLLAVLAAFGTTC